MPRRKGELSSARLNKSPSQADQYSNFDAKSMMSGVSHYSDVSIDPIVRQKAEKILESQKDAAPALEVIKEEGGQGDKLTVGNLRTLDNPSEIG